MAGREHYRARRFEPALDAFRRAWELDRAPELLYNIGRCLEQLDRYPEAIDTFERLLEERPDYRQRDAVLSTVAFLRGKAEESQRRMLVSSDPVGAELFVGDDLNPKGRTPLRLWLPYGAHDARLVLDGYGDDEFTLEVVRGGTTRVDRVLPPPPGFVQLQGVPAGAQVYVDGVLRGAASPTEPFALTPGAARLRVLAEGMIPWESEVVVRSRETHEVPVTLIAAEVAGDDDDGFEYPWYAWTTTGLTAAGLGVGVAFTILGVQSGVEANDYAAGAEKEDPDKWSDLKGETERNLLVGGIGFGVAGAAAIGTGVALWLANSGDGDTDGDAPAVTVAPFVDGAGVSVEMRF